MSAIEFENGCISGFFRILQDSSGFFGIFRFFRFPSVIILQDGLPHLRAERRFAVVLTQKPAPQIYYRTRRLPLRRLRLD
jgi:hypothetical protein